MAASRSRAVISGVEPGAEHDPAGQGGRHNRGGDQLIGRAVDDEHALGAAPRGARALHSLPISTWSDRRPLDLAVDVDHEGQVQAHPLAQVGHRRLHGRHVAGRHGGAEAEVAATAGRRRPAAAGGAAGPQTLSRKTPMPVAASSRRVPAAGRSWAMVDSDRRPFDQAQGPGANSPAYEDGQLGLETFELIGFQAALREVRSSRSRAPCAVDGGDGQDLLVLGRAQIGMPKTLATDRPSGMSWITSNT